MADGHTNYYNFILPESGHANATWGTSLNGNFVSLDTLLKNQVLDPIGALNAQLHINQLILQRKGATPGSLWFLNGDKTVSTQQLRMLLQLDATAETGGNVSSNLTFHAYKDDGTYLGWCLTINRSTQRVQIAQAPVVGNDVAHKTYVDGAINSAVAAANTALASNYGIVPIGTIILWPTGSSGGTTSPYPTGWVQCFGQYYQSKDLPQLANAIGGYWHYKANPIAGFPDNFEFGVPPLNGRVPVGWDGTTFGGAGGYYVGLSGGVATLGLTIAQLPFHDHGYGQSPHGHTISDPQHDHAIGGFGYGVGAVSPPNILTNANQGSRSGKTATGVSVVAGNANIVFTGQGSGGAPENRQPFCVLSYLIRYA